MKLDFDITVVSRFFRGLVNELGNKKLWPVAAVLLAAIVAVPVLLSKSSHATTVAQAPLPTPPIASATSVPTLNVQATPGRSRLTGRAHNPFAQAGIATGPTTGSSTSSGISTATGPGGTAGGAATGSGSASGGAGANTTGTSASGSAPSGATLPGVPAVTPPSITGTSKPKPAPTGLSATQSYNVALAITNSAGGVNTVDPLTRLSLIPNDQQPLLVELGVLRGKNRVLFAVEPGTIVNGPGACIPGPIDCEIVSLGQDQTEAVSSRDSSANALFAITGITAVGHSSVAAAGRAREAKSSAGQAVLDASSLPALSLFKYEPSVGSVVDLRDLGVN